MKMKGTRVVACTGPTWSSISSEGCVAAIEQAPQPRLKGKKKVK